MGGDKKVLEILHKHATPGAAHRVFHYLYFDGHVAAASAVAELRSWGFEVADKPAASGENWLVLACHEIAPSESAIERTRALMEGLASAAGGKYDGWEVEIRQN